MDLKSYLFSDNVDTDEFLEVVSAHFGTSSLIPDGTRRIVKKDDGNGVIATVGKDGKIIELSLLAKMPQTELDQIRAKIQSDLVDNQVLKVGSVHAFSGSKLLGYFKYKDYFQILPVPRHAPQPIDMITPQPLDLEFSYKSTPNSLLDFQRREYESLKIIRFLNIISPIPFSLGPRNDGHTWVFNEGTTKAFSAQKGYTYEGFSHIREKFTDVSQLQPIKRDPYQNYYSKLHGASSEGLIFPDNTESMLDKIFALNKGDYYKLSLAATWLTYSHKLWDISNSAGYIALVNTIESMLDHNGARCKCCGQPIFSVTKKFVDFIEKYTGSMNNKDFRKFAAQLYLFRSDMSHGITLFEADKKERGSHLAHVLSGQWQMQMSLSNVVITSLINWLLQAKVG